MATQRARTAVLWMVAGVGAAALLALAFAAPAFACQPHRASFTMRPSDGVPGTEVLFTGSIFDPQASSVSILWGGPNGTLLLSVPVAPDGTFSATARVPADADPGWYAVAVRQEGAGNTQVAPSLAFHVTQPATSAPPPGPAAPLPPDEPVPAPGPQAEAPGPAPAPAPQEGQPAPAPAAPLPAAAPRLDTDIAPEASTAAATTATGAAARGPTARSAAAPTDAGTAAPGPSAAATPSLAPQARSAFGGGERPAPSIAGPVAGDAGAGAPARTEASEPAAPDAGAPDGPASDRSPWLLVPLSLLGIGMFTAGTAAAAREIAEQRRQRAPVSETPEE